MLRGDGTEHTGGVQTADGGGEHSGGGVADSGGGGVYHGSGVLLAEQTEVYALGVPLLRAGWLGVSHHRCVGYSVRSAVALTPISRRETQKAQKTKT